MSSKSVVSPFSDAHRRYVQHLYRRALKSSLDWYVQRDLWRNKAIELRVAFEQNRNVKDPRAVAKLLHEAELEVQKLAHPDPYRPALFPGGTKWERNLPPPMFSRESVEDESVHTPVDKIAVKEAEIIGSKPKQLSK